MSSTDRHEDLIPSIVSQRAALEGLEWNDPLLQGAYTRVSKAWDELSAALYVVGISLDRYVENKLSLGILADAFSFKWYCHCREPEGADYLDPERAA